MTGPTDSRRYSTGQDVAGDDGAAVVAAAVGDDDFGDGAENEYGTNGDDYDYYCYDDVDGDQDDLELFHTKH